MLYNAWHLMFPASDPLLMSIYKAFMNLMRASITTSHAKQTPKQLKKAREIHLVYVKK